MDELVGFDPLDRLEEQAGDDRLNSDPGAIVWCLDDKALVFPVAQILPLGHDLNSVADFEGFGAVSGNRLFHDRR